MRKIIVTGALSLMLVVAHSASAADPSSLGGGGQSKLSTAPQAVTVKERTDNEVENKKRQRKSEREKREEKGGGISRSDYETANIESKLDSALDNEINYMEPFVKRLPKDSEQRPEIMRRLIENLHQKSLLTFFNESRSYDQAWNRWDAEGRRGVEPKFNMNKSKLWTSKVIQRCQQYVTEYPRSLKIDEVYYQLAYAFDQLGQTKEAAQYYSLLVAKYPNSKKIADAHYALGEYHFSKLDFKTAMNSFKEVSRYARAPIRPWAEFKIAWCYFNLGDFNRALDKWKLVVDLSSSSSTLSKKIAIRLKDESLRDMLLAFVEVKQVAQAMEYLRRHASEKQMGELYNKLANQLQEKGEYDESVNVLKTYIGLKPNDFRAAELQVQIVDTANLKSDKKLLWIEIQELNKNFSATSSWAKTNAKNPELRNTLEKIQNVNYTYAKKMHFLGQKEKSAYYLEQAIKGYSIYLATYGNRKEANEIRFLLGELQYSRDQYRDAEKTFSFFTSNKDLRASDPQRFEKAFEYQRTSAYFIVQKEMVALRALQYKPEGQPRGLSRELQEYVNVCDAYMAIYPKKPGTLDCQLDTAEIYLKTNNTAQAEKRLTVLARERASQKEGKAAAEFLLVLAKGDNKKLISTTNSLAAIPALNSGDLGKRLAEIKRSNRFNEVQDLEKGGKFEQAAQEFERIAADKSNPTADVSLFNAGVNYKRANRLDKSILAFQRIISEYPKSNLTGDSMLEIIDMSAGRLQLQVAVNYARMYLSRFPNSKKAPVLMAGACAYYEALAQAERAREVCPKVIAAGGTAAAAAAESMAGVLERSGRYQDFLNFAEKDLLRFSPTSNEKIEVWNRIEQVARRAGNSAKATAAQRQILKIYEGDKKNVTGTARSYVGAIAFAKEFPLVEKFRRDMLLAGKSGKEFQENIKRRNSELQSLTQKFAAIAQNIGDAEWSVASLYVIGYAHEVVAGELLNPPQPPGVSGEAWQKAKDALAELGKGLQKKAKDDYYASAAVLISDFNIYTDYGQRVLSALARIEPAKYRRADDWVPSAIFVGTEVINSSNVKSALEPRG